MHPIAAKLVTGWDATAMLDLLPERVNRYRVADLAITYCNAAWAAQYDVDPTEAVGRHLDEFLSADEMDGLRQQLAVLGPERPLLIDSVPRAVPNASGQWLEWVDRYLPSDDGGEVLSVGRDVSARHLAELQLAESEARFRDLADNSSDIVWHLRFEPRPQFDYLSPSVEGLLGYPPSYFLDDFTRLIEIVDDEGRARIDRAVAGEQALERFDFRLRHADGSIVVVETRSTSAQKGMQGVTRDVTELRRLQEATAALALRDPLTGLANRRLFDELLDAELARTDRAGVPLAVAYIDLDGLKQVNDTYGHDAGDHVLRESARRLVEVVGGADVVARLGGDEFAIVFEPDDPSSALLVDRIDAALTQPFAIPVGVSVSCAASIGCADTTSVGREANELLAAADEAMYRVKRTRRAAGSWPPPAA